jgi:hypothetical protein
MPAKRVSIRHVMLLIALTAANLALIRELPGEIARFPTIWVFLGVIDFVFVWKLVLVRPLRGFHYTCMIVFVVAFVVMANQIAMERIHLLRLPVRWYQRLAGEGAASVSVGLIRVVEPWAACVVCFVLASAAGWIAAWLERRRRWDIAAIWRGALLGLGVATALNMIEGAAFGWEATSRFQVAGRLALMAACVIAGGFVGPAKLNSRAAVSEERTEVASPS